MRQIDYPLRAHLPAGTRTSSSSGNCDPGKIRARQAWRRRWKPAHGPKLMNRSYDIAEYHIGVSISEVGTKILTPFGSLGKGYEYLPELHRRFEKVSWILLRVACSARLLGCPRSRFLDQYDPRLGNGRGCPRCRQDVAVRALFWHGRQVSIRPVIDRVESKGEAFFSSIALFPLLLIMVFLKG